MMLIYCNIRKKAIEIVINYITDILNKQLVANSLTSLFKLRMRVLTRGWENFLSHILVRADGKETHLT